MIIFTKQQNKFCLSLHYDKVSKCVFVNGVEIYKFKAKYSKINAPPLCLNNVSKDVSLNNKKKTRLYGLSMTFHVLCMFFLFVYDYDTIDVEDILDIHKYLMKSMM